MLLILVLGGLILLMIFFLVDPGAINDTMQFRIDPRIRSAPPRYPHFAVILIFLLGSALFYEADRGTVALHIGHFEFITNCVAALFLALVGAFGCYFPLQFMRFFVRGLRDAPTSSLDNRASKLIEASGKVFGALFLLGSSFVTHLIVRFY
jgi:hypothetical protein